MSIKAEVVQIKMVRYSVKGVPTCSIGPGGGESCRFLQFKGFGQNAVCGFTGDNVERFGATGLGYLKPVPKCIFWRDEK